MNMMNASLFEFIKNADPLGAVQLNSITTNLKNNEKHSIDYLFPHGFVNSLKKIHLWSNANCYASKSSRKR